MADKEQEKVPEKESEQGNKVGYKCPPKEHQFKPGQSGNPNGGNPGWKKKLKVAVEKHYTEDKVIAVLEAMLLAATKYRDVSAARLWLERGLGKVKDQMDLDVTTQGNKIIFTVAPSPKLLEDEE